MTPVPDCGERSYLGSGKLAGRRAVLVPNAAHQSVHENREDITDEEFDHTFRLNMGHYFSLVKAALPHLNPGASIIATAGRPEGRV
jgi:NAD(P)-dependent dehydrogenase (short-subunit alcohol dehydrogenase family)